jgi:hypothetical protein
MRLPVFSCALLFVGGCCGSVEPVYMVDITFDPPLTELGKWFFTFSGGMEGNCDIKLPFDNPSVSALTRCDTGDRFLAVSEDGRSILYVEGESTEPEAGLLAVNYKEATMATIPVTPVYEETSTTGMGCADRYFGEVVANVPAPIGR